MWSKRPCLSNVKLGVVSGSTQLRSNSRATPATKAHLKCETWDPGSQGPKWIRHVGLVHNLLDISHQNFNDAFLPRGPKRGHPQRFPAGQCLLNMPTRPPGEAPRRPPKSPAGDHPGGRHKLPGELQRALTGPQDTTQESPPKDTAGQCLLGLRFSVHEIGTKSTAPDGIKKRYSTTCVWCIGCSQNTYEPDHNKISTQ